MTLRFAKVSVGLSVLLCVSACELEDRCDPGYEVMRGACVLVSEGDGDGSPADIDAGVDDAGPDGMQQECAPGQGSDDTFGKTCSSDVDCGCPAPVCAPVLNYCTQLQCGNNPEICPDGFTCFEIPPAMRQDGVSHLCLKR